MTDVVAEVANGLTGGDWLLRNRGANPCFIGAAGVTPASGYELGAGETLSIPVKGRERVYAVCAATQTTTLHALTR